MSKEVLAVATREVCAQLSRLKGAVEIMQLVIEKSNPIQIGMLASTVFDAHHSAVEEVIKHYGLPLSSNYTIDLDTGEITLQEQEGPDGELDNEFDKELEGFIKIIKRRI